MNTIRQLQNAYPCKFIWFMVEKEVRDEFFQEIQNLGITFRNGTKPERKDIGPFMAVNDDNTIAFVSAFIFGKVHDGYERSLRKDTILVSYRKLIAGENPIIKDCR